MLTNIDKLKGYSDKNIPSIVDLQYRKDRNTKWTNTWINGHYVVVLAVDINNSQMTFMDPDWGQIRHLTFDQLLERWHDKDPYVEAMKRMKTFVTNPDFIIPEHDDIVYS